MPSREIVEHLKKEFPKGTRVELDYMDDPYAKLMPGDRGTVRVVDDMGTIHVSWDKGSNLGLVYGVDACHIIEEVKDNG
jgi:hypothetical protein